MSEQKRPCTEAIDAMRQQTWHAHALNCTECQAFAAYIETLSEEDARKYVSKLSEELTGDNTEITRNMERAYLNGRAAEKLILIARYGKVWDTQEMAAEFDVDGFLAPYVVVRRKSDGKKGSLQFQHSPRYYFNWQEA